MRARLSAVACCLLLVAKHEQQQLVAAHEIDAVLVATKDALSLPDDHCWPNNARQCSVLCCVVWWT